MKAFFLRNPGETSISEIAAPSPGAGDVLLRVRLVGMCGTDLNSFRGMNPLISFPRIPGHEISATIESAGSEVPSRLKPGLNVTVLPYFGCGKCPSCRRSRPNACRANETMGVQRDGAMTEYISMPWQKVVPTEDLSLRHLAMVEPLAIGAHAVRRGEVAASDRVAILGSGGVGLGAVSAAAHRGATVVAVDVDDAKLALAKKAGARETINTRTQSLHDTLQQITGGDGPDVVIEAIGTPETYRAAIEEVAPSGRVVYVGWAKHPVEYDTKLFVLKELDIRGSRNSTAEDFESVIAALRQGRFPVEETITRVAPFAEAGAALEGWARNPAAGSKNKYQVCTCTSGTFSPRG